MVIESFADRLNAKISRMAIGCFPHPRRTRRRRGAHDDGIGAFAMPLWREGEGGSIVAMSARIGRAVQDVV